MHSHKEGSHLLRVYRRGQNKIVCRSTLHDYSLVLGLDFCTLDPWFLNLSFLRATFLSSLFHRSLGSGCILRGLHYHLSIARLEPKDIPRTCVSYMKYRDRGQCRLLNPLQP